MTVRAVSFAVGLSIPTLLGPAPPVAAQQPWVVADDESVTVPRLQEGDVYVVSGGSLTVRNVPEPGFQLRGNLWVIGTGQVRFENSVIQILSQYHGQYALVAAESALLQVVRCDYRVPASVQHAILAAGNATVTVTDTDFVFAQLLATGNGTLTATRLVGMFEVILQESGNIVLDTIPRVPGRGELWVWPEFPSGSTAVYSPPLPGFVSTWTFPPLGATGIHQSVRIRNSQVKLWPLLVREGSHLTLRDISPENWVVVGLHLPSDATMTGLVNGRSYAGLLEGLTDRELFLENAAVDTWNLYPEGRARVTVRDSVIGELLASDSSTAHLERTTVDGSGGYFGAGGASVVDADDCTFTCDVQATQDSTMAVRRSRLRPYPADPTGAFTHFGAYEKGRLLLHETTLATTGALSGSGVVGLAFISNPPLLPPARSLTLTGTLALFSLDPAMTSGWSWSLEASRQGVTAPEPVGRGFGNAESTLLGIWSGADPFTSYTLRARLLDGTGRTLSAEWPVARLQPSPDQTVRPRR